MAWVQQTLTVSQILRHTASEVVISDAILTSAETLILTLAFVPQGRPTAAATLC